MLIMQRLCYIMTNLRLLCDDGLCLFTLWAPSLIVCSFVRLLSSNCLWCILNTYIHMDVYKYISSGIQLLFYVIYFTITHIVFSWDDATDTLRILCIFNEFNLSTTTWFMEWLWTIECYLFDWLTFFLEFT